MNKNGINIGHPIVVLLNYEINILVPVIYLDLCDKQCGKCLCFKKPKKFLTHLSGKKINTTD